MSKLADFLSELKHRRVYRVAVVYAGVAFIISEIVANTIGYLNLPDSFGTAVIVILIIGFPIVIGLAWAFDITDEGIVRAKGRPADARRKTQPLLGNKSLAVIAVLAIIVAAWALLRGPSVSRDSVIRIGVLPFVNISADSTLNTFADGITEEIIGQLAQISSLHVFASTTMFTYKGLVKTIKVIGEELDADVLLEGKFRKGGETISISAQLIDARTEGHRWADTYEREEDPSRVLQIEAEIAQKIVEALRIELTPEEEERLTSAPQVNPEAYDWYIRGWQQRLLETSESIPKAVEYLEQSVALDPTFAPAWAALSISYWLNDAPMDLVYESNAKALDLDPNDVTALTWRGVGQTNINYYTATTTFRRALDLEPSNTYARYEYGQFLFRWGQPSAALAEFRLAQDLDPDNPLPPLGFRWVYNHTRQYDKALEYARLFDELRNEPATDYPDREGRILMQQGRYEEAAALAEEAGNLWLIMLTEWALGNREKVYAIRDSMVSIGQWPQQEQENPFLYARFYGLIGEKEQALGLLETLPGDGTWFGLVYYQEFDALRAEPRFKAILQEIGQHEVFDENGNFLQPLDETLEAYNAPGSR